MAKFDVVKAWIDNVAYSHSKSENTEREYRYNLTRFCDFIGKTPEQILKEYEEMTDREFRRKYARYVRALISHLMNQDYSPSTVVNSATTVKSFFKYNDLPLGHIPVGKRRVIFHNRDITKNEIEQILKASRPRDRAFLCMMAQSGLRPLTLCSLKLKHIEPEFSEGKIPCKIEVPEEIAKGEFGSYFTFIGEESVKHLKAYFVSKRPGIDPEDYLFTSHGSEKQLSTKSISGIFVRILENLKESGKMDFEQKQEGKPRNVRLYNLRKFFRQKAGHQASIEYVNFWMGHRTDYKAPHIPASDVHYFSREDVEYQRAIYKTAMPDLRLETATPGETEQTIMELRKQVTELNEKLEVTKLAREQIDKIFKGLEKWQKERDEVLKLKSRIAGIENFYKMVLEQPDEEILKFLKDIRRQLKEQNKLKS